MTKPLSAEMLVSMWSRVVTDIGDEAIVLVIGDENDGGTIAAFRVTEDIPIKEAAKRVVIQSKEDGRLRNGSEWAALMCPSYTTEVPPDEGIMLQHGDLQRRYEAGDETVHDALTVIWLTVGAEPMGTSFRQPLLEQEGPVRPMGYGGMSEALTTALILANIL